MLASTVTIPSKNGSPDPEVLFRHFQEKLAEKFWTDTGDRTLFSTRGGNEDKLLQNKLQYISSSFHSVARTGYENGLFSLSLKSSIFHDTMVHVMGFLDFKNNGWDLDSFAWIDTDRILSCHDTKEHPRTVRVDRISTPKSWNYVNEEPLGVLTGPWVKAQLVKRMGLKSISSVPHTLAMQNGFVLSVFKDRMVGDYGELHWINPVQTLKVKGDVEDFMNLSEDGKNWVKRAIHKTFKIQVPEKVDWNDPPKSLMRTLSRKVLTSGNTHVLSQNS